LSRTTAKLVKSVTHDEDGHAQDRFSDEQIIGFLNQAEAGMAVAAPCRMQGFSDATFYKWRTRGRRRTRAVVLAKTNALASNTAAHASGKPPVWHATWH